MNNPHLNNHNPGTTIIMQGYQQPYSQQPYGYPPINNGPIYGQPMNQPAYFAPNPYNVPPEYGQPVYNNQGQPYNQGQP